MKSQTTTLFRHGQSAYLKGNSPSNITDAFDLCAKPLYPGEDVSEREERAKEEIREHLFSILIPTMDPNSIVVLRSSPVARAIHTAKVIKQKLEHHGFAVTGIHLHDELTEVHNFSWALFEPLVQGGIVDYGNDSFTIDPKDTNPSMLDYSDFFATDAIHKIAQSVKAQWPKEFVAQIESFEKFPSVTERSLGFLQTSTPPQVTREHSIFVAHDANAMYLADKFTEGRQKGLVPGTSLSLEYNNVGKLVVTRVGDITDGDSTTDFFQEFLSSR